MILTYYDIELKEGKSSRWQPARLYADRIEWSGGCISRVQAVSLRKHFLGGYRLAVASGTRYLLRGHSALAGWLDFTAPLRRSLTVVFFVLALLLGLWRPGLAVYPAAIFFALLSALCGWGFHILLLRGTRQFTAGLVSFFLLAGIPLFALLPPFTVALFLMVAALLLLVPLWLRRARQVPPPVYFPALAWMLATIVNFQWLQVGVKLVSDWRLMSSSSAIEQPRCDVSEGICQLGEQSWRLPAGWRMEPLGFISRLTVTDIPSQIQAFRRQMRLTLPPHGDHGWLAVAPLTGTNLFGAIDDYIKNNRRFFWSLYLGPGSRRIEEGVMWQSYRFFNPNKLKEEMILGLYLPAPRGNGWAFLFTLPDGGDPEYYVSRILEGFL